ncbi:hypothetical protein ACLB1G_13880 [Oxalobacteraceae bacterium A2-2]
MHFIDRNGAREHHGRMTDRPHIPEEVADNMAERLGTLELSAAVMRANSATKEDLAKLAAEVAVIKSNYVTKDDLLKATNALLWKLIGVVASLVAVTYFIARTAAPPYTAVPQPPPAAAITPR